MEELWELFLAVMGQSSSEQETLDAGGDNEDNKDGGEDNAGTGVSPSGSTRLVTPELSTPALREMGLVEQMEEEAREAGLGGWFNGMDQGTRELEWAQL